MRTFWITLLLLGVAAVAATWAVLDAIAPPSCGRAKDGLAAGLLVQSAKQYAAILATEPSSQCAEAGMKKLCTQAQGLRRQHRIREAHAVYTAMFTHEPGHPTQNYPCAEVGENITAGARPPTTTTVVAGPPGPPGPPGKNGVNGVNGVNGANGTNGTNGTNGVNGLNGVPGRKGLNGRNGTPGRNGANGKNGLNGKNGAARKTIVHLKRNHCKVTG